MGLYVLLPVALKRAHEAWLRQLMAVSGALSKPEGEALSGCLCLLVGFPLGVIPRLDRGTHHPNEPTRDGLHGQAVQELNPEKRPAIEQEHSPEPAKRRPMGALQRDRGQL